jgi:calcium/calmodulin-dependent protein kinase I
MMEMDILANIDHPSVVKLLELFDDGKTLYLIMEYMAGGELFDRIVQKEAYSEAEAMVTIRPILDAVRYCHDLDIIHRDLKPENLLYETTDETSDIKVTDFGVGRFLDNNDMASTAVGTPSYMAPEVWKGQRYGKPVDVWALGVISYIM